MTLGTFGPDAFAEALGVSRETVARFKLWQALLQRWNARINLVGARTLPQFWLRHALDGAQLFAAAPDPAERWLDVGAGAGIPGLAVALMRQDAGIGESVVLVEANAKKAAFLREAIRETGAPAEVMCERIENVQLSAGGVGIVSARAYAPLARLFETTKHVWTKKTVGLFLKGQDVNAELSHAHESWAFQYLLTPSRSDPGGQIVLVQDLKDRSYDGQPNAAV